MKLEPMNDRVVVRPAGEDDETTEAGLYIPEQAREEPMRGEVVAVGGSPSVNGAAPLAPGDTVIYGKYSGTEIAFEGETLIVLHHEDLLCRVAGV